MDIIPILRTGKLIVESVFRKFNINKRTELRLILSIWNFSEWEDQG